MLLNWAMRPCGRWILWYTVTVDPWVYLVLGWAPCGALSAPKKAAALSATIAPGWWQRASSLAVAFLKKELQLVGVELCFSRDHCPGLERLLGVAKILPLLVRCPSRTALALEGTRSLF